MTQSQETDASSTALMARTKQALSIPEFCAENGIGRTTFYKIVGAGEGPRLMKVGKRVLITVECAAAWRRSRLEPVRGSTFSNLRAESKGPRTSKVRGTQRLPHLDFLR